MDLCPCLCACVLCYASLSPADIQIIWCELSMYLRVCVCVLHVFVSVLMCLCLCYASSCMCVCYMYLCPCLCACVMHLCVTERPREREMHGDIVG